MTIHGMIFGKDLDMLHLPTKQLEKLSPDRRCCYNDQRMHNVIRRAWILHAMTGHDISDCLDLCCVREYAPPGGGLSSVPIFHLLSAHHCNDWHVGLPLFVEEEVKVAFLTQRAGPLLQKIILRRDTPYDRNPFALLNPDDLEGYMPHCVVLFKKLLVDCRNGIHEDRLRRETVHFIERVTGRQAVLQQMPPQLDAFFDLAEMLIEYTQLAAEPIMRDTKPEGASHSC